MNKKQLQQFIENKWQHSILETLMSYIKIPNKSPHFDADWKKNGYMHEAVQLVVQWCQAQALDGMQLEVLELENRTPLIYIEIPGQLDRTIMMYGHLDKQPEMTGWRDHLGPWKPVLSDDKLYGRGSADDGYAIFSALTAIHALKEQNIPHARCIILIECCEESGSYDLPFYIQSLSKRIQSPDLIIGLDSGCGNYQQMWITTSLRGLVAGELSVYVLEEGLHSGMASGIVPCSFRIIRQLLDRIENSATGEVLLPEFQVSIPSERIEQAKEAAKVLQDTIYTTLPLIKGMQPMSEDLSELLLNRTWRAFLSVISAEGLPSHKSAGNVLRPFTSMKLSIRIPPMCDPAQALTALKKVLESHPPLGVKVIFKPESPAMGWNAPKMDAWLAHSVEQSSNDYFGLPVRYLGEGGTIPFMGMLGQMFPNAQFIITGVLGPHSNAHGPNEFLHLPTAKKLTCAVAQIVHDHYQHYKKH